MIHIVLKLSKIFDGGKECLNSKEIIKCPQKHFFSFFKKQERKNSLRDREQRY